MGLTVNTVRLHRALGYTRQNDARPSRLPAGDQLSSEIGNAGMSLQAEVAAKSRKTGETVVCQG